MNPLRTFSDILDAIEELEHDSQVELVRIMNRRLVESAHARLVERVREAQREYAMGLARMGTPEEIIREAMS